MGRVNVVAPDTSFVFLIPLSFMRLLATYRETRALNTVSRRHQPTR